MLQRVYVWEIPVRLTHWVNVAAIIVLSFTGYYIGNPWIQASSREWYGPYFMGIVRYVHFVVAFVFIASLLLRTYWAVAGNEWASWRGLFPFLTPDGRKYLLNAVKYYFFLRREPPEVVGHNALAGLTYAVIVILYFLQTFTGLALLGQADPNGLWHGLTNWVFVLISNQTLRLVHHLIMWLLIAFALHHVYSAFLVDAEEGNGLLSSIFTGFKFIHADFLKRLEGIRH
ncbi:MAG: Ni/Fe-hydrogenase, b-type cytochrome subunit [Anaerolineae bacterium]